MVSCVQRLRTALSRGPSAKAWYRRVLSGLCGLYLLSALLFSALFVILEADHDCEGHGCGVCLQLQACLSGLQDTGAPVAAVSAPRLLAVADSGRILAESFRPPAITLQSLYVRMDE